MIFRRHPHRHRYLCLSALLLCLGAGWWSRLDPEQPAQGLLAPRPRSQQENAAVALPAASACVQEFQDWAQRYVASELPARKQLLAAGVALAKARQRVMADMALARPEAALAARLPYAVRKQLPAEITAFLETPVNTMGSLYVAGLIPLPGREGDTPSMARWAEAQGKVYSVATFGRGLEFVTKKSVPLHGIAFPAAVATNPTQHPVVNPTHVLALDENPARFLESEEIADALAEAETPSTCPTGGQDVTMHGTPALVELGGSIHSFCGPAHMREWAGAAVAASGLTTPDPDVLAQTAASSLPVAASGYTEGYKRMLFLRPRFTDSSSALADTISDSRATALMNEFINHMNAMSWGRLKIAPLGPGGSQFTPALTMPQNAAYYNDGGLSRLYPEARTAAQAAGFNLGDYAFSAVFSGGRPSAGYAGLAYVGGVGIHIANGYYGLSVFIHEFGHNLGLPHAHRWDTSDRSIVGDGTNVEYGNGYDPMGGGNDAMHYTASHKAALDYIPAGDAIRQTVPGIYRIHVCDNPQAPHGLRGLRVSRNGSNDYWAEFRSNIGGTEFANGLLLHFSNKDGKQSYLTDALPKQGGITLPIGKTFWDRTNGVFITPHRLIPGSFPQAMDVAVGFAANATTNRPPTAMLIAHNTHGPAGVEFRYTVEAEDADGDALAYYWDFGNDTHSWNSLPTQTVSYNTAGEFAVHCVVSDTKGGEWRKTFVQRVGALPTEQVRISGRVVDADGKPMPGVFVNTDGGLYAWTDTDGSYALCRVPKGVHAVNAYELTENKLTFVRTFSGTTNWTANTTGADLSLTDSAPEILTSMVPKLSTWKYNDTGVDQGTAWRAAAFDDAAWAAGPGMLGYGNGGEGTVISFGGDAQNKRTTAYFRKKFTVADPSIFKELRLSCKRDDAVMVFLNGTRIYQDNFPAAVDENTITYATTAADSTEPDSYQQQNGLAKTLLVAGENILCAEVHQVEPTSSDLAFDAELVGVQDVPSPGAQAAYVTSPEPDAWIDTGTPSVTITADARARTATVSKVEFFVDNVKLGEDATAPYAFVWPSPAAGVHALHVAATYSIGSPVISGKVSVTVGPALTSLIAAGSVWKYRASTSAAPANWMTPEFSDAAWPSGPAQLGYGETDERTNISPSGTKYPQTQFRRTFTVADPLAVESLLARIVRDDAAVVYLNGVLAFRSNFTSANVAQAAGTAEMENLWHTQTMNTALLRPGLNTLAVEIHQDSPTSSDVSFDFALEASSTAGRTRGVYFPVLNSVALPTVPELTVEALPGDGLTVSKVEFFANGTKLGEDTTYPFGFLWNGATVGTHTISAVATDSAGATFTGTSASLIVRLPASGTAIVKWGDTWKYLDNGSDPGPNWVGRTSFDDAAWPEGNARFGYGGDGEVTSLFVRDASAKPATVYFRKKFTVANPAAYDALRLRTVRDDGISVQINRIEVLRDNVPEGILAFSSLALASAADEQTPLEVLLPTTSLRAGENQLTVEVHQAGVTSSDLSFDLELVGLKSPAAAVAPSLWLTAPVAGQMLSSDEPVLCTVASASLPATSLQRVEYFAGAAKIGQATASPWSFTWPSALRGTYNVSAKATLANGTTVSAPAVSVTVGAPVTEQELIWPGSEWRFLDTGVATAATWTSATFTDTAWKLGRSRIGFGGDGESTYVTPGFPTYWFRKSFAVPAGVVISAVDLRVMRDDGVALYLNGNRIWLNNLAEGATPADFATASVANADEQTWLSVPLTPAQLVSGNNILAAEVHQSSATSTDVAWDLQLTIQVPTPGGLLNTTPTAKASSFLTSGMNGLQLSLNAPAGSIYRIEQSANLSTWSTQGVYILPTNTTTVPLSQFAPTTGRSYFRARWQANP